MQKLSSEIKHKIFDYKLLERNEHCAMYSQNFEGELIGIEVFAIKIQKETDIVMGGNTIHLIEKELFPSDNDFGVTAFSVGKDMVKANKRFIKLTQNEITRKSKLS